MKKASHLIPALVALAICIVFTTGWADYARRIENRYVHAIAATKGNRVYMGSAVQKAAFLYPDLLPLYGSSELTHGSEAYRAPAFFKHYPTNFMVFQVARPAANALLIAQALAGVGPNLRGKKLVFSFTPSIFLLPELTQEYYNGNFSRLHAYEFIFNSRFSFELKQLAAQRMLEYPDSYKDDPLLQFALQSLTSTSPFDHALYTLSWPLGNLTMTVIQMQDHAAVLEFIQARQLDPQVLRKPTELDWDQLLQKARAEQKSYTNNNPYGVDNTVWEQEYRNQLAPPGAKDAEYLQKLNRSKEWIDFDILLRVMTELGARPLLLSRPLNGPLLEALGISRQAQSVFYEKLHRAAHPYQFRVFDFREYDTSRTFSVDKTSHSSEEGFIYVNQVLDAFYHGTLH